MRDKILEEAIEWYRKQNMEPDDGIEEFVDLIYNKTIDSVFEKINDELKIEFEKGNLKHPFIISDDYYLYLKLKEIKQKVGSKKTLE